MGKYKIFINVHVAASRQLFTETHPCQAVPLAVNFHGVSMTLLGQKKLQDALLLT